MDINLPLSLGIFSWRDVMEISFFTFVLYRVSLWLKEDEEKNLLPYLYGFCTLLLTAHLLALPTISQSLFIFSPSLILLFMFLHKTTLQRNFISLKNISAPVTTPDWLSIVMQSCLTMFHNNKELLLVIEHTDAIAAFVKAEYAINAPINKDLFNFILEKVYNPHTMMWINSDGIIRGINVSWKASWYPNSYEDQTAWRDDAIAHTGKNDAMVLHINPSKHHYTIAMNGTLYEELTIEQVSQLIKKKINYQIPVTKKGSSYDVTNKKNIMAQHLS